MRVYLPAHGDPIVTKLGQHILLLTNSHSITSSFTSEAVLRPKSRSKIAFTTQIILSRKSRHYLEHDREQKLLPCSLGYENFVYGYESFLCSYIYSYVNSTKRLKCGQILLPTTNVRHALNTKEALFRIARILNKNIDYEFLILFIHLSQISKTTKKDVPKPHRASIDGTSVQ